MIHNDYRFAIISFLALRNLPESALLLPFVVKD